VSTLPTGRFDAFLHSAIDDDHNGMALTVLSAFARKDLDPWDEAESLLRLGPDRAVPKLAEFIRGLPPGPMPRPSAEAIAIRLIGLLTRSRAPPARGSSPRLGDVRRASAQPALPSAVTTETKPRSLVHYLLFYLLFVAVLVGSQWLSPSSEPQGHAAAVPATVVPSAPASQ
jgi:hypothetical protein